LPDYPMRAFVSRAPKKDRTTAEKYLCFLAKRLIFLFMVPNPHALDVIVCRFHVDAAKCRRAIAQRVP
jgi:hypothetical protein